MKRIAVPVRIAGNNHGCGISDAIPNSVIGRVFCENGEVLGIIYGAELPFGDVRAVKEVVAEHV